ncbi:hypothetical protein [Limnoglobus roseus]|uniref:Uncharacterized protein n=1 Tax=Limnoglobus roseus TaxID=2598579 RepID=A0A5C1AGS2_9BACT|nr:hypothetical protein [Limnoglobus roseus]QEL18411.1 hypothetical protein PX52LOC_05435 [Limnoglobus roseus]
MRFRTPAALCAVLAVATTVGGAWSWAENRTAARQLAAAMAESDHLDEMMAEVQEIEEARRAAGWYDKPDPVTAGTGNPSRRPHRYPPRVSRRANR